MTHWLVGAVGAATIIICCGLLLIRRYYLQKIEQQSNQLTNVQQVNQEQAVQLTSANTEIKRLQETCHRLEIDIALGKQKIGTQSALIEEVKTEKNKLMAKLEQSNNNMASLESNLREQQAILRAEEAKLVELKEQFEKQKTVLKNEFKVVSEEIIKERQQLLHEQNKEGVSALLKPLQEQIAGFQRRINEVHLETVKGNTNLEAEIKKVMEVGIKMRDDASNLTSALKGNSQQRGAWGEAQLERTLEISGLVEHAHYEKQSSFKDREGRKKQTDYLIKLPGNKHIIIDSKVSLIAYDAAIAAETDSEQATAMNEHVKAVQKHIDDLASKDYTNLIGIHSPSFVLMFMPIEPAYIEALKHSRELFSYGYDKNIVLVSHTTLIPILRTVANLWMLDQSNREAREISDKAGDIYNSVCIVADRFKKLGNTLSTASSQYNQAVTAIAGKRGLQGKVERFTRLSNKVSKTMPELEPHQLEYDTLQLDIQPLEIEQENQLTERIANGNNNDQLPIDPNND